MKKVKGMYLPLVLIILYLVVSYAMYRFGCYVWPFRNDLLTAIFVLLCIVAWDMYWLLRSTKDWKEKTAFFLCLRRRY